MTIDLDDMQPDELRRRYSEIRDKCNEHMRKETVLTEPEYKRLLNEGLRILYRLNTSTAGPSKKKGVSKTRTRAQPMEEISLDDL